MYLKEIRTVGFKSFAEKINFELNCGITGIVGPNGSGKSNVVDAVRWVLGEQSVKELRGEGGMSDVIFSGSNSRKPLNSASVSLIFDNSDHHLKIDYTEVSIQRRVHRNGENEYYINNKKCRLKDITDLLVDTGVGKESYNIISQGKVGEIISSKSHERRIIFEEAAGVLKYKKRKEEALRKLKRTHDNLDRVNDIINELEIQVKPLEEQSLNAKRYLMQKKELENIEIALISHDIEKINNEYQSSKNSIEILNNELLKLGNSSNLNNANLEKRKNELQKIEKELYESQNLLVKFTSEVEKLDGQKKIALERKQYKVEDTKLHNNAVDLHEKELKLVNDIELLNVDIKYKLNEVDSLEKDINDFVFNYNKLKKEKMLIINDLEYKTKKEIEINHKIKYLENSIESNSLLPKGVRSILNNPKLNGIYDVIGNLISFDSKYSNAISIALGAASNFIVCKNEVVAKESIGYLKNNNLGRATFFPINIIKSKSIDFKVINIINKDDGFINIACNLVSFDNVFKNIINNQLGMVIVARDIDSANRISKKINHRYKIVTLDGEIIHVGGSLTGGINKGKINLINEKYEYELLINNKKILINDLKLLEEKINDYDVKIKSFEDLIYEKKLKRASINETINSKKQILINYNDKLEQIKEEVKGINDILDDNLNNEETLVIEKYYEAIKKKENVILKVDNLNKERNNLKDFIDNHEFEIKQFNSEFNKKNNDLKDLEIKVNRMDVKLDNLLNYLNEEYNLTFEKARNDYELNIEENDARIKVNDIKLEIKKLGMVNISAIEEFEKVNTRYLFLLNQKEDLYKAENVLLEIVGEMDIIMEKDFSETFEIIKKEFSIVFKELFGGGFAELCLTDPSNMLETGVDIIAQPPGKKLQHLSLLSGGEKTLTAISLLFAILKTRVVPFSILDEVEAALDEVNVDNFGKYLAMFKNKTQFIIITHKKKTMEYADTLYGITMQESGVSKLVSVKLDDIVEEIDIN